MNPTILIPIIAVAIIGLVFSCLNYKNKTKYFNLYSEIKPKYDDNCKLIEQLNKRIDTLTTCIKQKDDLIKAYDKKDPESVANMYADMITIHYSLTEHALRTEGANATFPVKGYGRSGKRYITKVVFAPKAADKVKDLEEETKKYIRQYECMKYKYSALLEAFPGIEQYVDGKDSLKKLDDLSDLQRSSIFRSLENKIESERTALKKDKEAIQHIVSEASVGKTKWLSNLIADYHSIADNSLIESYKKKKYPITIGVAKDLHDLINGQMKELRVKNKEFEYLIKYYQEFYPELEQTTPESMIGSDIIDEESETSISEEKYYKLSPEEYHKLEPIEKNQLALDNYWHKNKTKWVVGRDYERYVGYLFENKGYKVIYQGALNGKEDRGIDLIAENQDETILIQCKYWRPNVPIRENAINQLYGTSEKYKIDSNKIHKNMQLTLLDIPRTIKMWFITSTTLSDVAKEYAKDLNIKFSEQFPLKEYPIIKCNISNDGKRIYHLPFDQQYDTTKIERQGEFYATTVKEAEDAGFRHAFRWRGENNDNK